MITGASAYGFFALWAMKTLVLYVIVPILLIILFIILTKLFMDLIDFIIRKMKNESR